MNEKLLKIINKRQLVSMINKTKWKELCNSFEKLHNLNIAVRYKLIISNEITDFSPVWWDEIFEESMLIEWLDFDPIVKTFRGHLVSDNETNRSKEILDVLHEHNIKYSKAKPYYRIWGYLEKVNKVIL